MSRGCASQIRQILPVAGGPFAWSTTMCQEQKSEESQKELSTSYHMNSHDTSKVTMKPTTWRCLEDLLMSLPFSTEGRA